MGAIGYVVLKEIRDLKAHQFSDIEDGNKSC